MAMLVSAELLAQPPLSAAAMRFPGGDPTEVVLAHETVACVTRIFSAAGSSLRERLQKPDPRAYPVAGGRLGRCSIRAWLRGYDSTYRQCLTRSERQGTPR